MKIFSSCFFALAVFLAAWSCGAVEILKESDLSGPGYIPKEGFVPEKDTALSIGAAVLVPIYGAKEISDQSPLIAILKDDVWTISGSLPVGSVGGVVEIKIDKISGRILKVSHGK